MMAGTQKGKEIRHYFLECERIAKKAVETIPAQSQEIERLKLELELLQARQKYQDSGYAIQLSTSPAMLQWLYHFNFGILQIKSLVSSLLVLWLELSR